LHKNDLSHELAKITLDHEASDPKPRAHCASFAALTYEMTKKALPNTLLAG
jgi:hypothetical protein